MSTYVKTGQGVSEAVVAGGRVREYPGKTGASVAPFAGVASHAPKERGAEGIVRQWQRGDITGTTWADIPGETGKAYTITTADQGHTLRLVEYDYNMLGNASAPTSATAPVFVAATGAGVTPFVGQGADADTFAKTGAAVAPFTGGGGMTHTFPAKTGAGVAVFTGSGHNQGGTGISAFTGKGADVDTAVERGTGIAPFTGTGDNQMTYSKTGVAISEATARGHEIVI